MNSLRDAAAVGRVIGDANTVRVLDHGFVHLRDAMPHWHYVGARPALMPADARVVEAARVSMGHVPAGLQTELGLEPDVEQRSPSQDVKLIDYLMKNAHTSPFEKVRFEFVVKLPIFIARQWIRHRTGSFNEVSARYAQLPCQFYVPELDRMQAQSTSNKQASGEALSEQVSTDARWLIKSSSAEAYKNYEALLVAGLARELARMVLPTNFYTQWYWTVDLHNLMHFLKLRLHPHAQYEIRVYAEAILAMVERIAPVSIAAFRRHTLNGVANGM
jgi:thymidylate synthase (FAD)